MQDVDATPDHQSSIFLSYAQADLRWCERLRTHLAPLLLQHLVVIYQSAANGHSTPEATQHFNCAHIILLLISPNFIASDACQVEMKRALERYEAENISVIPVCLSAIIDWEQMPFEALQPLPENGKPITEWQDAENALSEVARGVSTLVKQLQHQQPRNRHRAYRRLIVQRPASRPEIIVQRLQSIKLIYEQLIPPDMSALVLTGVGGVGKSTLASLLYDYVEMQRHAGQGPFKGKTLWLKMDMTVTLADILGTLREALQQSVPNLAMMTTEDIIWELSCTLQATEQPFLVVLDQFEALLDPQTGQALRRNTGISQWLDTLSTRPNSSRILFTSRFVPRGTRFYPPHFLRHDTAPPFSLEDCDNLLRLWNVNAQKTELRLAVEHCQGHAFALVLLCSLLNQHAETRVATFFQHPWYRQQRVEMIAEELLNHMFTHQLNQDQRDLLCAFAIYREAIPVEAAQAVINAYSNLSIERAVAAHRVLLNQQLLLPVGSQRYQSHRLIIEFVWQHLSTNMVPYKPNLLQALHRQAADYYQQRAIRTLLPRQQRRGVEDVHDLIEAIWHFCQAEQEQQAYDLIVQESIFADLQRWGANGLLLDLYQYLLPSTRWNPSPEVIARIYHESGEIFLLSGQRAEAKQYFEQALQEFRTLKQPVGMMNALNHLGMIYRQQGQITQAMECYHEAKSLGDQIEEAISGKGITFNNLGYAYSTLGRQLQHRGPKDEEQNYYQQAVEAYQQALSLYRQAGDFTEETRTLNNLGETYQALGQEETAYHYYQQALKLARKWGDQRIEATVLSDLGILTKKWPYTAHSTLEYYKQALTIFRAIGAHEEKQILLKNLGYWYLVQRQYEVALAFFVLAKDISNVFHNSNTASVPRIVLSELRLALGQQSLQDLQNDLATRAEQVVEQVLQA